LIDQMFPHATCELLDDRGHDAVHVHVRDRGVDARPDAEVVAVAAAEHA
jgi:predicted nuclease of predicted toxin-antitoxin system